MQKYNTHTHTHTHTDTDTHTHTRAQKQTQMKSNTKRKNKIQHNQSNKVKTFPQQLISIISNYLQFLSIKLPAQQPTAHFDSTIALKYFSITQT
jgi:hypothetical protein